MGLSIQVGGFEEPELYAGLSQALIQAGLSPHEEPEGLDEDAVFSCR